MQTAIKRLKMEDTDNCVKIPGVTKDHQGICFSIDVPSKSQAALLIYSKSEKKPVFRGEFEETAAAGRIRSLKLQGMDWRKYRYLFEIDGEKIIDPCARKVFQGQGEMDFSAFDWGEKADCPGIPFSEAVMYHLHVRNYTMHKKSGVRHKGTFLGLQEKIPYLKELGINQVLLMPVYEFCEKAEEEKEILGISGIPAHPNYWGYQRGFYFAPKRGYAFSADPVREFKQMVRAFHENQIEVLLEFFFDRETPLTIQAEVLRFWRTQYRIDGFRILGDTSVVGYVSDDPYFAGTKLLTDGVNSCRFPEKKAVPKERHIGEMNDGFLQDMRRILKGDEGMLGQMLWRIRRNPDSYGIINYMTSHDGFTLQDLVSYDQKHNEENGELNQDGCACNYSWNCGVEGPSRKRDVLRLRKLLKKNAVLLMMLSQGTPMLMAGDEFCNSQNGNNNPYCQDNEISWVDWSAYKKNSDFFEFVRKAIAFRKKNRVFHQEKEYRLTDYCACGYPDLSFHSNKAWYGEFEYTCRQAGMLYCKSYLQEQGFVYVMYNLHPEKQELALPKLPEHMAWHKMIDTSLEQSFCDEEQIFEKDQKTLTVPARTILVLEGRKEADRKEAQEKVV